jgi:hypothetical protein
MRIAKKKVTPAAEVKPVSPEELTELKNYIKLFLKDISHTETALARDAEWNSKFSAIGKVVLIFLGAFVATKGAASQLLGANSIANTVIFTLAGLVIAVIAGLDAAFKWEKTSADLKGLAATCRVSILDGITDFQKSFGQPTNEQKRDALEKLLGSLTKNLEDIYSKSATLGINLAREVRHRRKKIEAQSDVFATYLVNENT